MTIKITKDDSLKMLGLFALANYHYAKCREAEFAINRMLGREGNDQGAISDAIYYSDTPKTADEFYAALLREGVSIVSEKSDAAK